MAELLQVLGDHIDQRGSIVLPERLRFDFSHTGVIDPGALASIEDMCVKDIARAMPIYAKEVALAQAKAINGECSASLLGSWNPCTH